MLIAKFQVKTSECVNWRGCCFTLRERKKRRNEEIWFQVHKCVSEEREKGLKEDIDAVFSDFFFTQIDH